MASQSNRISICAIISEVEAGMDSKIAHSSYDPWVCKQKVEDTPAYHHKIKINYFRLVEQRDPPRGGIITDVEVSMASNISFGINAQQPYEIVSKISGYICISQPYLEFSYFTKDRGRDDL